MQKDNTLPATKQDLRDVEKKLDRKIDSVEKKLDRKIDSVEKKLDRKIDSVENILRYEIKLSADETKEELKEEMSKNTSKILNTMDKFLEEINASRQERNIVSHRLSDHEDRIEKLEKTVLSASS